MTPSQIYSNIFGRPWPGGTSPEIVGMLRALGITDAPGSAAANTKLAQSLQSGWRPGQTSQPSNQPPASQPAAPSTPQTVGDAIVDATEPLILQELEDYRKLFTDDDPFAYDKALAERSLQTSTEKYDPEFQRKMNEFLSDIGVKLESFSTRDKLINELTTSTEGIAGQSNEVYRKARENAVQGLYGTGQGALSSGSAQRKMGELEIGRGNQVNTAADALLRGQSSFEDQRQAILGQGQLGEYRRGIAEQVLPRLTTYTTRYPGGEIGGQSQQLINQFTPWLQNNPPTGYSSPVPEISRGVGLL